MEIKKELVFCVYVFGEYNKYIPYYIYGITKSYPEHHIKILVHNSLTNEQKKAITLIDNSNVEIKENCLNEIKFNKKYIKGGNEKILKWLIPHEELYGYKYAYIGDVDMFIVKEFPSLLESHIEHMNKIGLPFSNAIRKNQKRLTGLHFIDVEKYYQILNPIINEYLNDNNKLNNDLKKCPNGNEEFLYNMIKNSIGFGAYKNEIIEGGSLYYRPHHGLHIGLLRIKNKEKIEILPDYINDDLLQKILKISPLPELNNYINKLKK